MAVRTIAVIGAGTMGSGIALAAALTRFDVLLNDISAAHLKSAMEAIKDDFREGVRAGTITTTEATEALSCIHPRREFTSARDADFIIEAAAEDLAVKQEIFRRLDAIVAPEAILATTTSSLSVTAIAEATKTPDSVVGMHFFDPPVSVKLVEVVRGRQTSAETIKTTCDFAVSLHKTPVVCTDSPGFIVDRISQLFFGEALELLGEQTASVEEIDRIVKLEGGFSIGPFELMDLNGIDRACARAQSMYKRFRNERRFAPHPIQHTMIEAGLLGRKSKKGFYSYT